MNRAAGRPPWWSVTTTRTALRLIPPGGGRDRWQRELVAELYGLSRSEQARHTLGVVSRAIALRRAVTAQGPAIEEDVVKKPIRCRLGWHSWIPRYSEDGTSRYVGCRRCSKETDAPDIFQRGLPG